MALTWPVDAAGEQIPVSHEKSKFAKKNQPFLI